MRFLVVMRDHERHWHSVAGPLGWGDALTSFIAMVETLRVLDYYPDYPPSVAKIIRSDETDYAGAVALAEPGYVDDDFPMPQEGANW